MTSTSYADKYTRVDGSIYEVRRQRYICSNKAQNCDACDGSSGYVSERVDGAVEMIVCEYLSRIKTKEMLNALKKRYQNEFGEMKSQKRDAEKELQDWKETLSQLYTEISKVLAGESDLTPEMLTMTIDNAETELKRAKDRLVQLNEGLDNCLESLKKLGFHYEQICGWAEVFKEATFPERKMIICQLIREIKVSRGYKLDVVMDMSYEQYFQHWIESQAD